MNNKLVVFVADVKKFANNKILPQYARSEVENTSENQQKIKKSVYGLLRYAVNVVFGFDDNFESLTKDENGKPVSDKYYLSISHKNDLIAVALSTSNVGVDIEYINPKTNAKNILKTIQHVDEISLNLTTIEEVMQLWVKKEAKFKFDGDKKFVPNNINTSNLDFSINEFRYRNGKYYLSVFADDYQNLKVVYLI